MTRVAQLVLLILSMIAGFVAVYRPQLNVEYAFMSIQFLLMIIVLNGWHHA